MWLFDEKEEEVSFCGSNHHIHENLKWDDNQVWNRCILENEDILDAATSQSNLITYEPRLSGESCNDSPVKGLLAGCVAGISNTFMDGLVVGGACGTIAPSMIGDIFEEQEDTYCSVFAPTEVKRKQHMLVQVFLHLDDETEKVRMLGTEADRKAERRGYEPLQLSLKKRCCRSRIEYKW